MPVRCWKHCGKRWGEKAVLQRRKAALRWLEAEYIQFPINPTERKLSIRPCDEGARDVERWCAVKGGKRKSREITCRPFTTLLYGLMGWESICRHKLQGVRINY